MPSKTVERFYIYIWKRETADSEYLQGWWDSERRGGASLGSMGSHDWWTWSLLFSILGLKLLYQNSLHFINRVYLLLDFGRSPVKSRTMKPLFPAKEKCRHLFPPLHLCFTCQCCSLATMPLPPYRWRNKDKRLNKTQLSNGSLIMLF